MMAVYSPSRFSDLAKCHHTRKKIAERLKVPRNFIIDQERVRIDTVSAFSQGAFAKVIRAEYHGAEVRVKRIHAILTEFNRLDTHRFLQECRLASDLRHPNIVHFYGVVMDGRLPMLMMEELVCNLYEFIDHPEKFILTRVSDLLSINVPSAKLDESLDSDSTDERKPIITERLKISIALGVAQGLDYLHTKKPYPIVHRDLSSSNILLGTVSYKTVAKIADFGQSKEIKTPNDWSSHNPGTLTYLPPEVLLLDTNGHQQQQQQQQQQQPVEMGTGPLQVQPEVHDHGQAQPDSGIAENAGADDVDHDIEQVPQAQEPDEVQIQELSLRSRPKLRTSIDMYMYGVLVSELGTQQLDCLEKKDDADSWHTHHVKKLEKLNKESILYRIANGCVLESPSDRFKAAEVITEITQQFASTDTPPNKDLVEDRNHEHTWDIILRKDIPQEPSRSKRTFRQWVSSLFTPTPEGQEAAQNVLSISDNNS